MDTPDAGQPGGEPVRQLDAAPVLARQDLELGQPDRRDEVAVPVVEPERLVDAPVAGLAHRAAHQAELAHRRRDLRVVRQNRAAVVR